MIGQPAMRPSRPFGRWRFHFLLIPILLQLGSGCYAVESSALIVVGISPSVEDSTKLQSLAVETKRLLIERGLTPGRIEILNEKATREIVLGKLRAVTESTNDEFWLVLYGISGKARGNQPAFQVGGPRLTAADLKTALDAIPARQFVFIGTGNGGGFLPVLKNSRRTVLSATQAEGEPDLPRFPEIWLKLLAENPKAPFNQVAAKTSAGVEAAYLSSHLALSEHAQLADPATDSILEPPFGVNLDTTNSPVAAKLMPK